MQRLDITEVPYTCPLIDDVISFIKYCSKTIGEHPDFEFMDVIDKMEKIRSANDSLRSFGLNAFEDWENASSDIDYWTRKYHDCLDENNTLQVKISHLINHNDSKNVYQKF